MTDMQTPQEDKRSLYERLGGYDNIYKFAAAALRKSMENPVIGHVWNHMSESTFLKEHINFVDFLCSEWGGNAMYRGRDMVTAHRGMGLKEEHWVAMFECIYACYDDFGIPQELRTEIDKTFNKYKGAVIGSPSYREVVLANPQMDITKGLKSVGIHWPAPAPKAAAQTQPASTEKTAAGS